MSHDIDNSQDLIDSRDIIERIEELQADKEANAERTDVEADSYDDSELSALLALQEEAEGYASDWEYGATLIRDSYFPQYAEQLADDIGAVDRDATWPLNCIDWEEAARQLQQDYTKVDYDGVTYWVR